MGDFVNVTENKILIKMHLWMAEKKKHMIQQKNRGWWRVNLQDESNSRLSSHDRHAKWANIFLLIHKLILQILLSGKYILICV